MTIAFRKGRYGVRVAQTAQDVQACQALRARCFGMDGVLDVDAFDPLCQHIMIGGEAGLVATCRVMPILTPEDLIKCYAAQRYDISSLSLKNGALLELGRFCVTPDVTDADVVRLVWAALTQMVDQYDVALMFGCPSFAGTDPAPYADAFAFLASHHRAPTEMNPAIGAPDTTPLRSNPYTHTKAIAQLPPLLRTYLTMGGWVSDHAVVDRDMNTLHVFCGVEVARIPAARARALRALAQ